MFISGGNPHLTRQFCGVVLGPTTNSKSYHLKFEILFYANNAINNY